MEQRTLGASSLQVSRMGLGLAALGRPGYLNLGHAQDLAGQTSVAALEEHTHTVLDHAWQAGVRYYDAARSYGMAEAFLASWLKARAILPTTVTVGSKWGYIYTAGWQAEAETHEVKEHSLELLQRQLGESRQYLAAHLKLYQIHSATLESGVLDNWAVLARLARLKEQGISIGLSVSGPRQTEVIARALEVEIAHVRLFDAVQATWNLLEPTSEAILRQAHAAGVGVIIKEALANGRLTSRNSDAAFASRRTLLARHAERLHTTIDALALAAVLAQPWVDVVLSGAATVEQLTSNLAALHVPWDAQTSAELAELAEPAEAYWANRRQLPWS